MAIQFSTPTIQQLNSEALAGDEDAALQLAKRAACTTVSAFVERFVPAGEIAGCFDRYADAWARAQQEKVRALLDTLELPVVEKKTNMKGA